MEYVGGVDFVFNALALRSCSTMYLSNRAIDTFGCVFVVYFVWVKSELARLRTFVESVFAGRCTVIVAIFLLLARSLFHCPHSHLPFLLFCFTATENSTQPRL